MPLVVLEGVDGSGKTVLAKTLIEMNGGGYYIHATYRHKSKMSLYHMAILKRAIPHLSRGELVIIDRWWPSEYVYGTVYRGQTEPVSNLRILHRLALRYGVTYVLCHRESRESAMTNFAMLKQNRTEMYESDERIGQLHDLYQQLWAGYADQYSRWSRFNLDRAIADTNYFTYTTGMIMSYAAWYDRLRTRAEEALPHSSGSISGQYLMVGEKVNPTYHSMADPWVGFRGSSLNITDALRQLGKEEHWFLWTNAIGPCHHSEQLRNYLREASFVRKVVAMGDVARKFCEDAGRCDVAIPHPAYLTRFHGFDSLVSVLNKVL